MALVLLSALFMAFRLRAERTCLPIKAQSEFKKVQHDYEHNYCEKHQEELRIASTKQRTRCILSYYLRCLLTENPHRVEIEQEHQLLRCAQRHAQRLCEEGVTFSQ